MNGVENFSLLLPTYAGDKRSYVEAALESIVSQTRLPSEIVIVFDGPVSDELRVLITSFSQRSPVSCVVVEQKENLGLGPTLQNALETAKYEWVARMDADDISVPERFERQCAYLEKHPEVDLLGGCIEEFSDEEARTSLRRVVPSSHDQIVAFMRFRNPMNHVTVMFRKSAALRAGGYRDFPLFEDYDLWSRFVAQGSRLANLTDTLVRVRTGREMYGRRGGWAYALNEVRLQRQLRRLGLTSSLQLVRNLCVRVGGKLVPTGLRAWVYRKLLRAGSGSG
jgi:glycosyltransferase involved in cell wall biosynthesis